MSVNNSDQKLEDIQLVTNLVLDTVKSYIGTKNVHANLDPGAIDIITRVLDQFPQLFDKINNSIRAVMEDGVFDANDIPTLVLMVKDVINVDKKELKKLKVTRSDAVSMLEGVLIILIEEDIIKAGDKKDSMKSLLRLSVRILEAGVDLDETINCGWLCC